MPIGVKCGTEFYVWISDKRAHVFKWEDGKPGDEIDTVTLPVTEQWLENPPRISALWGAYRAWKDGGRTGEDLLKLLTTE